MKYENPYQEAMRYIENAEEILKSAGKEGKFFIDEKYVHTACGTAYIGMLKALDFLFDIKQVQKKRGKKSIEYYQSNLSNLDKKLLNHLNSAYNVLHLEGYYHGEKSVKVIEDGFDSAVSIINSLKPYSNNGAK
ncbi:MAG: hypothetical protein HW421_3371 [Ignavibacteria bacterium]|nr:hypothetical protein [Ignavibacteria bacterium]